MGVIGRHGPFDQKLSCVLSIDFCASHILSIMNHVRTQGCEVYVVPQHSTPMVNDQFYYCIIRPETICFGHLSQERGRAVGELDEVAGKNSR